MIASCYQLIYVKEVLKRIFQLLLLNAKTHWAEFIHLPDYIREQNWSVISDLAFAYEAHIRTMGQGKKCQMSSIFLNQFPCWESCERMMPWAGYLLLWVSSWKLHLGSLTFVLHLFLPCLMLSRRPRGWCPLLNAADFWQAHNGAVSFLLWPN